MTVTVEQGSTGNKNFYALWELALVDLTIKVESPHEDQNYIFTVTNLGDPAFKPIKVVLSESNGFTVTIVEVPVGTYRVEEVDEWSWRLDDQNEQTVLLGVGENRTVTFTFAVNNPYWLNGYSDGKWKKGVS